MRVPNQPVEEDEIFLVAIVRMKCQDVVKQLQVDSRTSTTSVALAIYSLWLGRRYAF